MRGRRGDALLIALQLYTLRERARADLRATLQEVANAGYRAVELAGLHGHSPADARRALDDAGLRAPAAHVPFSGFDALGELHELGCSYAVLPGLPDDRRAPRTAAEALNDLGARCTAAGLRFAYHNHAWELETGLLDELVERTDPALVSFELDLYWAHVGGGDPVGLLERCQGRVELVHMKDAAEDGSDAPVGEGVLRWPEIVAAARAAGVRWYVVEQDEPADPLRDVETALQNAGTYLAP